MIANYRCQAELSAVESSPDGKALVLGTVDGCVSVLAILDPQKKDMIEYLAGMPSRDEEVRKYISQILLTEKLSAYKLQKLHYNHESALFSLKFMII